MTAWLALRQRDRRVDPLAWIAILILATLRSPFLPGYGAFPALWLATLVMAVARKRPTLGAVSAALWLLLALQLGQGATTPQVNAVLTFGHTLARSCSSLPSCRASTKPATAAGAGPTFPCRPDTTMPERPPASVPDLRAGRRRGDRGLVGFTASAGIRDDMAIASLVAIVAAVSRP